MTTIGSLIFASRSTVLDTIVDHVLNVLLPYHDEPLAPSANYFFLRPTPFAFVLLFDLFFVHAFARPILAAWRGLELLDRFRKNCFFFGYFYLFYVLVRQLRYESEGANETTINTAEDDRQAILCRYFTVMILDHLCRDLVAKERSFGVFQLAVTWFFTLRHKTTSPVLIVAVVDSLRKMLTHAPSVANPYLPRRDTLLLLLTSVDYGFLIWSWLLKFDYPSFWLSLGVLCTAPVAVMLWALSQIVGANVAVISFILFLDWMLIHFHLRLTENRFLDEDELIRRSTRGFAYDGPRTPSFQMPQMGTGESSAHSASPSTPQRTLEKQALALPKYCEQLTLEQYDLQRYEFTKQSLQLLREHALTNHEAILRRGVEPSYFDRYLQVCEEQHRKHLDRRTRAKEGKGLYEDEDEEESDFELHSSSEEESESFGFPDAPSSHSTCDGDSSSNVLLQCVVCMDAKRELMVKPCNHLCLCICCADRYVSMAARYPQCRTYRVCPVCRYPVDGLSRVYL